MKNNNYFEIKRNDMKKTATEIIDLVAGELQMLDIAVLQLDDLSVISEENMRDLLGIKEGLTATLESLDNVIRLNAINMEDDDDTDDDGDFDDIIDEPPPTKNKPLLN